MSLTADYEVLRELAHGTSCVVHLARERATGELVALKEFRWLETSDEAAHERFMRGVLLGAELDHPNIVKVHGWSESGSPATHDGTAPFMTMEYLERGSLRRFVRGLTLAQIAAIVEDVTAGLGYAAEHRVVHRDIKPENLLVADDGTIQVTDFALATVLGEESQARRLTPPGMVVGTPAYMAPEQAMGQPVGVWTDLYALGCVAFELVLGFLPLYDASSPVATMVKRANDPVPDVHALEPTLDPELAAWIEWLLARDPADRPQSAHEAWTRLEAIVERLLGAGWRQASELPAVAPPPAAPRHVVSPSPVAAGGGRLCPSCGRENPQDADFCACGEYLRWEATGMALAITPAEPEPAPPAAEIVTPPVPAPPPPQVATPPPRIGLPPFIPSAPFAASAVDSQPLRHARRFAARSAAWARARGALSTVAPDPGARGELIECTVSGPARAGIGQTIAIDALVRPVARGARARAHGVRRLSALGARVERGRPLDVELSIPGLEVEGPRRSTIWRGNRVAATFSVRVPRDTEPGDAYGTAVVRCDGVPLGHLGFRLRIVPDAVKGRAVPLGDAAACHRRAFLSYAAEDGELVRAWADRLLQAGLEFPSPLPGEPPSARWERRLYPRIGDFDVFLLFWSPAASDSWWVRREVAQALALARAAPLEAPPIVPVPLVSAPGWPELSHLHLGEVHGRVGG